MDIDVVAVGRRVRIAREGAGLSQREVEAKVGMSQSTLHRVETGMRTSVTLADFDRLAQALEIALDELLYGSPVQDRVLAAARTAKCPDDDLRSALAQAVDLLKLDDRLDALLPGLRQQATRPTLELPTAGGPRERGRVAAEQVRRILGLDIAPIGDLVEVVEFVTGVDVGTVALPSGVSGVCATDPHRATSVVLVNCTDVAERQRFTLAHELGHLVFGDTSHVDAVNTKRSPREQLCDEFARHLLIPRDGVDAWLARTVSAADKVRIDERSMALMARHFGVSLEATRVQLDRMGLLPTTLREVALPTGRRCAYRYGWGPQFDSDQTAAMQPRVPRRVLDRATEAYRDGKLGIGVLARLQDRSVDQIEQALNEAGVVVTPAVRRADIEALVARDTERKRTVSRSVS
jgi:Zn-dependent peptidase ImmA (M78 family)/DNA-binding Xre family transcriptional regulator